MAEGGLLEGGGGRTLGGRRRADSWRAAEGAQWRAAEGGSMKGGGGRVEGESVEGGGEHNDSYFGMRLLPAHALFNLSVSTL